MLLNGTTTVEQVAALLLAERGEVQGTASNSLFELTGAALVEKAFWNALNRAPTPQEAATWTQHIASGGITEAQFVAALARSVEAETVGADDHSGADLPNTNVINAQPGETVTGNWFHNALNGSTGDELLDAKAGSDVLNGGAGNDTLRGAAGNDRYIWAQGDGNDTIQEWQNAPVSTDILELTDVDTGGVTLAQVGDDMHVTITATGEVITVEDQFVPGTDGGASGKGIETIQFADGGLILASYDSLSMKYFGTSSDDAFAGSALADELHGLDGADSLDTGDGADTIYGGTGDDTIAGADGNDLLDGGEGNDVLDGGAGADILDGGDGDQDKVSYAQSNAGVTIDLIDDIAQGGHAEGDWIEDVEWLEGSAHDDVLRGDENQNHLTGGDGNDNLYGKTGRDILEGGNGADFLGGGWGNDTLLGGNGDDVLQGSHGADLLTGGAGADEFKFLSGDGADTVTDFDPAADSLRIDGTVLDLNAPPAGVTLGSANGDLVISYGNGDQVVLDGILEVVGTDGSDVIDAAYIDPDGNTLNDFGQIIDGGDGNDQIYGGTGDDTLYGGDGNDTFYGSDGADHFDGGAKKDAVDYSLATSGVIVNPNDPTQNAGMAAGDTYVSVGRVFGSNYDDILYAGNVMKSVVGGDGDDLLIDTSTNSFLYGENGADTFQLYHSYGTAARVMDFDSAEGDRIDVSDWGTAQFSDLSIVAQADRLIVSYDDGNGIVSAEVLGYTDPAALTESDFIFA